MPRYTYRCQNCDAFFQIVHSIKEKLKDCEECQLADTLQRIPSIPFVIDKLTTAEKRPVGNVVKEYIEDVRDELQQEKRELSNQVYDDD